MFVVNSLVTAAVAAHFVLKSEGAACKAKLGTLSGLALVQALLQGWWWIHEISESTLPAVSLPILLVNILSHTFIYSATKSRAMLLYLCTYGCAAIVVAALNTAFYVDLKGRLTRHPGSDYSDRNLHWSLSLRHLLVSLNALTARGVVSYIFTTSQHRNATACLKPLLGTTQHSDLVPLAADPCPLRRNKRPFFAKPLTSEFDV